MDSSFSMAELIGTTLRATRLKNIDFTRADMLGANLLTSV
jgi:uncharacterized protein YjbI with pentapeptide repeats